MDARGELEVPAIFLGQADGLDQVYQDGRIARFEIGLTERARRNCLGVAQHLLHDASRASENL